MQGAFYYFPKHHKFAFDLQIVTIVFLLIFQ